MKEKNEKKSIASIIVGGKLAIPSQVEVLRPGSVPLGEKNIILEKQQKQQQLEGRQRQLKKLNELSQQPILSLQPQPILKPISPPGKADIGLAEKLSERMQASLYDSVPLYEINDLSPFQMTKDYIDTDTYSREYDNIYKLTTKAEYYLQNYPQHFIVRDRDDSVELPKREECFAVIFTVSAGPIMFDSDTKTDDSLYESFTNICSIVNSTYQPIYIFGKKSAYQLSAEEFLQIYGDIFRNREIKTVSDQNLFID